MTEVTDVHPRLEIKNLQRAYGGRAVVDDVSLKIMPGQVTCLLGPSGCGKSTTLRMIAGVEMQDSGTIHVDGKLICDTVFRVPPERREIGLMFQDFALFPHLSVADNVGFGLKTGTKAERRARIEELLERVDLLRFIDGYPHQLSGGEQQRVALARALAPRPKIMLMDEPFSGLDNRLRDDIRDETLGILKEEGTAVLLVTHEPEEAMRMADEIALMRDGKIVQQGPPITCTRVPSTARRWLFSRTRMCCGPRCLGRWRIRSLAGFWPPACRMGRRWISCFGPSICASTLTERARGRCQPRPTAPQPAPLLRVRVSWGMKVSWNLSWTMTAAPCAPPCPMSFCRSPGPSCGSPCAAIVVLSFRCMRQGRPLATATVAPRDAFGEDLIHLEGGRRGE